jgi:anti-sigma factor RsiW
MSDRTGACPHADTLVALALGELTGRARADVLTHLAACRTCQTQVGELADTVDRLLLVAPSAEPPAGFDVAVLDRVSATRPRPRRRPVGGLLVAAASLLAIVAVALAALVPMRTAGLASAAMVTPAGYDVGTAWIHPGDPGLVVVAVPRWEAWADGDDPPDGYRLTAELDDGTPVTLGAITFGEPDGSWGTTTTVDTTRISHLAIVDETGHVWCTATF